MARTRSNVRRTASRNRRKLVWARTSNLNVTVPGTTPGNVPVVQDLLTAFRGTMGISANLPGLTIMRIRGVIHAAPEVGTLASSMRCGVKLDDQQEAVDIDSSEGPVSQANDDWMLYEPWVFQPVPAVSAEAYAYQAEIGNRQIDVRSKRKLDEIQQTALIFFQAGHPTAWRVSWHLSVLLALP